MGIYIALAAIVIIVLVFIAIHNGLQTLKNKAEEAFATIDVYLKQRHDLIPNIVETVKGYAKHESGTLEKIVQARSAAMSAGTVNDKLAAENALQGTLKSLFALSEAYPDLKADAQFMSLQSDLGRLEKDLVQARKYYNSVARDFNTRISVIPASIVAGLMRLTKLTYFELDSAEERKNVQVKF